MTGPNATTATPLQDRRNGHAPAQEEIPDETAFWQARPELGHIAAFAHARMASRWAVLGAVLTRVICTVPPNVVLPPTILTAVAPNLFIAVVGGSGIGKTGASGLAAECVRAEGFPTVPVGSGEGVAKTYARASKTSPSGLYWTERSALFSATEVDTLKALTGRQGATLEGQLRSLYLGNEPLGFGYAADDKRIILPPYSIRAGVIVGVQPGRAGMLFDDTSGGTVQRFVFLPGTDPDVPRHPGPEPAQWEPPPLHWRRPTTADDDAEGRHIGPREIVQLCDTAADTIRDAHHQKVTGRVHGDPLDGHALIAREKVASGLAFLAGRKYIRHDDWILAGTVMAVSDRTRTALKAGLDEANGRQADRLALMEGQRRAAAEVAKIDADHRRIQAWILRKMADPPAAGPWTPSRLKQAARGADRRTVGDVLAELYPTRADFEAAARRTKRG